MNQQQAIEKKLTKTGALGITFIGFLFGAGFFSAFFLWIELLGMLGRIF